MNFKEYHQKFQTILNQSHTNAPYDNPEFIEYTKLNFSRFNRWLKKGELSDESVDAILRIDEPQEWIVITDHWCGDAAHSVPIIVKLAGLNSLIDLSFQLRDSEESEINSYLTNGSKSIPKLIVRKNGKDIFTWGPRPSACNLMLDDMKNKNLDAHTIKEEIQKWYNSDQGKSIQMEIIELLKS